jgi:hypothetical protein
MYTKRNCIDDVKNVISMYEDGYRDEETAVYEIQMWLNKLNNNQPKKIGFSNIQDAIDYYWEPSVNPNGIYEIDYELAKNEQSFCETEGFSWEEWKSSKQKNFTQSLDN